VRCGVHRTRPGAKLFHNLRASRETELAAQFPIHVVCAWIGNTEMIAAKHYLQVTEADFERATSSSREGGAESGAVSERRGLSGVPGNDESP
jgi:hypothetical protein